MASMDMQVVLQEIKIQQHPNLEWPEFLVSFLIKNLIRLVLSPSSVFGMLVGRADLDNTDLKHSWSQWWSEQSEAVPVDLSVW